MDLTVALRTCVGSRVEPVNLRWNRKFRRGNRRSLYLQKALLLDSMLDSCFPKA